MLIIEFNRTSLSDRGIILAIASGAIASGIGYTVWYNAVRRLSTMQASVVQLLVPVIAATGGVTFANEVISMRVVFSSVMILGGIVLVLLTQHFVKKTKQN